MGKFLVELLMNSNYGKVISLVCLIVFAVVYLSIPRNNYVICNSKDQECTVYHEYMGSKTSRNIMPPSQIKKTYINSRTRFIARGRGRHTDRYYELYVVGNDGRRDLLFDDLGTYSHADRLGTDLIYCISAQQYPCQVIRSGRIK